MFPQSESALPPLASEAAEFSPQERLLLLRLAHQSIEAALDGRHLDTTAPSEHLAEQRGAFTTVHLRGKLRGCIGYVFPTQSLYRTVAETAKAAASDDPRFEPVTRDEASELKIEISVLSALKANCARGCGDRQTRAGCHAGQPARLAPAPGPAGVGLGP